MGRVTVRVPATSANLGPGYDAFGLALGIDNIFSAELAGSWEVEVAGEGAEYLKADATNPVAQAMARVFADAGHPRQAARLRCDNAIPTGRGLGSSAAAIVGGLVLGSALVGRPYDSGTLLELATEIEGHPDNVAAAIHGGFVISAMEAGEPVAHSVPIGRGLAAILAVSELPFETATGASIAASRGASRRCRVQRGQSRHAGGRHRARSSGPRCGRCVRSNPRGVSRRGAPSSERGSCRSAGGRSRRSRPFRGGADRDRSCRCRG